MRDRDLPLILFSRDLQVPNDREIENAGHTKISTVSLHGGGHNVNPFLTSTDRQEAPVKSFITWITLAMAFAAAPALSQTSAPSAPAVAPARGPQTNWWSQAGGENGPERIVWAAQKTPETPYTGVNKPIWHIADILKSHQGQARWEEKVVLTRDFDGRYVQMASGDKAKCTFYADDRVFG